MPEHGSDGQLIHSKYPDATKRRLLDFLQRRHHRHLSRGTPRAIRARSLALALGLRPGQPMESRRRRVRELIAECRAEGAPLATSPEGVYLATEVADFAATERFLRRMGRSQLATAAGIRRSPARAAADGQLRLTAPLTHAETPGAAALAVYRPTDTPTSSPPATADAEPSPPDPTAWSEGRLF